MPTVRTSRPRRVLAVCIAAVVLAVAAFLARNQIAALFLEGAVRLATGYTLQVGKAQFGTAHGVLFDVHLRRGQDKVLDADRIDIDYALRDVFPGGEHRFGFAGLAINRPHIYLIRHKDGSFNVIAPGGGSNVPENTRKAAQPYVFSVRVRDGELELIDVLNLDPSSRDIRVDKIEGNASVKSDQRIRYQIDGAFLDGTGSYPIGARATIDIKRGYALHRITARDIPIRAISNYFIGSNVAEVLAGHVRDLDVKLYALGVRRDAPFDYHLGGSAVLEGIAMKLDVLTRPVLGVGGRIYFADDAIMIPNLGGTIGLTKLRGSGGMYNFSDPQFRLAIRTREDLSELHRDFAFLKTEPLAGPIDATTLLEGPVTNPLIFAHATSPRVSYGTIAVHDFHATVGYHDGVVVAGNTGGKIGSVEGRVAGRFLTGGKDVDMLLAVDASGAPGTFPYLDRIAPHATGHVTATAAGLGLLLDTHGYFSADGGGERVQGTFALNPRGVGTFGPLSVQQPGGGNLIGTLFMDREHGTSGLWAQASGITIYPGDPRAELAGVPLPPFPPIAGRVDAQVVGVDLNEHLILAGNGRARNATIAGTRIDDASAQFAGATERIGLRDIDAHGQFGRFRGRGAFGSDGFEFAGDLDGTLEGMRPWTGDLGAVGGVHGPVAIVSYLDRTVVQTDGVTFTGASIRGVPLQSASGTMAVQGDDLTVYAADAHIGGGRAFASGDGKRGIAVSANDLSAEALRRTGMPLERGRILANGTVRLLPAGPSYDGGVAVVKGGIDRYRVDASADLNFAGDRIRVRHGAGQLAGTLGFIDGTVAGLGNIPVYDLDARVRSGDLAVLGRSFRLPLPYLRGTLDGDFKVGGSGAEPVLAGSMRIPEGSVNGLSFSGAQAAVAADRLGVAATDGKITVGSTEARFDALARGADVGFRLDAAHANLADFNDYFDPADTLAGTGSITARFAQTGGVTLSGGTFNIADLRYKRFPFGNTAASWNGERGEISGQVAVEGPGGKLALNGSVVVPPRVKLAQLPTSSTLNLTGSVAGMDLNVWLPALGYAPPVLGRIDATGTIKGRYPQLGLDLDASLAGGAFGKIPVDRLNIGISAAAGRLQLKNLDLNMAGLDVTGTGSFALAGSDPLTLDLQAHTDRLGGLVNRVFASKYDFDGALNARISLRGTVAAPRVSAGLEVESLRIARLVIPSIITSADITGDRIGLRDAEIHFPSGTATLAGTIPLIVHPFGPGPPSAPLDFDVDVRNIGLEQFTGVMPAGTKLGGIVSGLFGFRGTVDEPQLAGSLHLAGGAYTGPLETEPITGAKADLELDGTTVRLATLAATIGGGTLQGSGTLTLPSLALQALESAQARPVYEIQAALKAARLAFAGYGSGRLDGSVALKRGDGDRFAILGGSMAISDASIPLGAFLGKDTPSAGPEFSVAGALPAQAAAVAAPQPGGVALPPWLAGLGLGLDVTAGNNVRVRSAILDVGGKGTVRIAGRLAEPTLDGTFTGTPGGTLFLNRPFKLTDAQVRFTPANGISPAIFARAATQVGNPPVSITVTAQGIVPDLKLSYSSNPPYDEGTIVGLLFGVTSSPSLGLNAFAPTTNIMLPPNAFQQSSTGTFQLSNEAATLLNAQFTARLLAPIEQGLGTAFGLSDLSLNLGPTGSFGIQARRLLGSNVSFLYGTSLTYPYRMTFGIESRPSPQTSVLFTVFTQQGLYSFGGVKPDAYLSSNPYLGSAADLGGTQGFTVNYQRLFR